MEILARQVRDDVDQCSLASLKLGAKRLQALCVGAERRFQLERSARVAVERVPGGGEVKDEFG